MLRLIQAAFSNFKFRSLFFRILFLLTLLVVMTGAAVGYFGNRYSQHVIQAEVKQSSIQMLEQTRRLMDALLNEVDQVTIRLAQNRAFSQAMEAGMNGPTSAAVDEVHDYLLESYTSSPYIESIYVYYDASGLLQTPLIGPVKAESTDDTEWLPLYRSMKRIEGKWFVRQYPSNNNGTNQSLGQTEITFIRTTPWVGQQVRGAVVVNMNQQSLFQSPSFRLMRQGEEIWMVSPDGSFAFNSNTGMSVSKQEFAIIKDRLGSDITALTGRFRGTEYTFTAVTSPYTGWKYVDVIPTGSLYKSVKDNQSYMLVLVILSITAAVLIAFFITLRIYTPIHSLLQLVNNRNKDGGTLFPNHMQNELAMLFSAFKSLKEQGTELETQLRNNWPVMQQSFLHQVIQEHSGNDEDRLSKFSYYNLPVTTYGFFVCVLRIDQYSAYVAKFSRYDQSLIRYFIAKVAEEVGGAAYRVYPLHTESRDVTLICNLGEPASLDTFHQASVETVIQISAAIRSYLDLSISAGIGECKTSPGEIADSYREALEALEYRVFKGSELVVPSWQLRGGRSYDHMLFRKLGEVKREIILRIRDEQPHCLEEELHKLGQVFEHIDGLPFSLIQHAYFQLVIEVYTRTSELGLPAKSETELIELQEQFIHLETVDQVVIFVQSYIRDTNRRFLTEMTSETVSVAQDILSYIQVNFDKDISLSGIAEKLQLDPSYVSRLFRQEISISFIDYVISLRLEKARELLKQSTLPIKDIGAAVGYANQRSFNRLFKKYEGVTPGEYRDIHAPKRLNPEEIY